MKKVIKGILNRELHVEEDRITIKATGLIDKMTNRENPSFFISDIKSLEFKPKQTLSERPNLYFNVTGASAIKDLLGNRSNDPYCFYFAKWVVDEVTEVYDYIIDYQRKERSAAQGQPAGDDIPTQIQKLAALKDAGILTEEEFSAKKAELLAKM